MPVYCYRYKNTICQEFFPMGKAPKFIIVRGKKAHRDYSAEMVSVPSAAGWPLECVGSGVNACQAQELRDHFRKVGVPTEVSRDGNPIYRDAAHRKKALKARGFCDKNSFN